MVNRICAVFLAGALMAAGGAVSAQCESQGGACPEPAPDSGQPTDISLAPRVTWLDPGKLAEAPERPGYARLSFRLLDPGTGAPLDDRAFADRAFLGWLGSYFDDPAQTYLLSAEVYDIEGGQPHLLGRRPIYAYTGRDSFAPVADNPMIAFSGAIGADASSDQPREVRLVLHRAATTDRVTRNVERLFTLSASAAEETETLLDPFPQVRTIAATRTLRHKDMGDTTRLLADFYPRNIRTAADREKHLRLEMSVAYTPSRLLTRPDLTWSDLRNSPVQTANAEPQPLTFFLENDPAVSTAWADVGTDRQDISQVCNSIAEALSGHLMGVDVPIAISAMLHTRPAEFSLGWDETACFGSAAALFDDPAYQQYRFLPVDPTETVAQTDEQPAEETVSRRATIQEDKLRTPTMTVLPAGLSGVLKIPGVRDGVLRAGSPYRGALLDVTDNGAVPIALCDETGLFDTVSCNGGTNATPYPVDALLERLAREVDLLEVDGSRVGLGCITFLADEGGDAAPNDLGSLAVIGNRTVEFLWHFRNRDGRPILEGLTISHPSETRAAVYEANRGGTCGGRAAEYRIWAFNGETEDA